MKGADLNRPRRVVANPLGRSSNALDADIAPAVDMSNALDVARCQRPRGTERGAPPGGTPHRNARGPVEPALNILGGAKMGT